MHVSFLLVGLSGDSFLVVVSSIYQMGALAKIFYAKAISDSPFLFR